MVCFTNIILSRKVRSRQKFCAYRLQRFRGVTLVGMINECQTAFDLDGVMLYAIGLTLLYFKKYFIRYRVDSFSNRYELLSQPLIGSASTPHSTYTCYRLDHQFCFFYLKMKPSSDRNNSYSLCSERNLSLNLSISIKRSSSLSGSLSSSVALLRSSGSSVHLYRMLFDSSLCPLLVA